MSTMPLSLLAVPPAFASLRRGSPQPPRGGAPPPGPPEGGGEGADERDDVSHQVALDQARQRLEVAERRRTDAKAVGRVRLAVAGDEVAQLPFRRRDRAVGFPRRRLG